MRHETPHGPGKFSCREFLGPMPSDEDLQVLADYISRFMVTMLEQTEAIDVIHVLVIFSPHSLFLVERENRNIERVSTTSLNTGINDYVLI